MARYKILVAYDGTDYCGWQVQPQPEIKTVAGVLQDQFKAVFKQDIKLIGASRTDAGVHALGQVASFDTELELDTERLKRAWSFALPESIMLRDITRVPEFFHPQRNVLEKTYYYHIFMQRPLPFCARYGFFYARPFDADKLRQALLVFIGTHDFRSFCTGYEQEITVRTITDISVLYYRRYDFYRITVKGPGFLRYMIRRIVGAALDVASYAYKPIDTLYEALAECNPHQHFPTAPASGLMLRSIRYFE